MTFVIAFKISSHQWITMDWNFLIRYFDIRDSIFYHCIFARLKQDFIGMRYLLSNYVLQKLTSRAITNMSLLFLNRMRWFSWKKEMFIIGNMCIWSFISTLDICEYVNIVFLKIMLFGYILIVVPCYYLIILSRRFKTK